MSVMTVRVEEGGVIKYLYLLKKTDDVGRRIVKGAHSQCGALCGKLSKGGIGSNPHWDPGR